MGSRTDLQALFEAIPNVVAVYFQAPGKDEMEYPCIIYERTTIDTEHANNSPYILKQQYRGMVIDSSPGSEITISVAKLSSCSIGRHYVADNLHHDPFTLYY